MFGDPEGNDVVEPEVAGGAEGAAEVAGEEAAEAKEEPKRKVTIPLEEYEALQRKARETGGRAGAESGVRANTTDNRAPEAKALQDRVAARDNRLARLRMAAEAGNEDAQVLVDTLETVQESEKRQLYRMEMRDVPESKRGAVREVMDQRGLSSPFAAYKWLRSEEADTLENEVKDLRAKLAEGGKPKPKVEGTKMRSEVKQPSSNGSANQEVTPDEWIAAMNDPEKRQTFKAAKAKGTLKIVARR